MSAHPYTLFDAQSVSAKLIFTPCPGTQDTPLNDALMTLKSAGVDALITVMPDSELAENNVSNIAELCEQHGLAWFHLPVADDCAPQADFESKWENQKPEILHRLKDGERIAIHCKGGSGRTGLIAAVLLTSLGLPLAEATTQIQALRPKALKHPVHVSWISEFTGR
ncbi:phosphatase domain-containing putative toxin [Acinetobacter sp. ANC 4640]